MAALRSLWGRFTFGKFTEDDREEVTKDRKNLRDNLTNILGPFEAYVVDVQSLLIWEKPWASALTFLIVNALFWFVVNCERSFYFSLGTLAAFLFVSITWVNQIWPEIRVPIPEGEDTEEWTPVNPQVLSVPEIGLHLQEMLNATHDWVLWLIDMRRNMPGKFCLLLTFFFVSTAVIGHYIAGVYISYIIMTVILLLPGFFVHVYPYISSLLPSPTERFVVTDDKFPPLESRHAPLSESDELDEFLPEPCRETMAALSCALDTQETDYEDSLLVLERLTAKEFGVLDLKFSEGTDFTPQVGLVDLPSHDSDSEDDEAYITQKDFRLEPAQPVVRQPVEAPPIYFVTGHFNGDSDDSEEERLAMGLDFTTAHDNSDSLDCMGVSSFTVSMTTRVHPVAPSGDDRAVAKSMMSPAQFLNNPNFSDIVPMVSDIGSDVSSSGNNGPPETAEFYSRPLSTCSDTDSSDFEIVSESELS